MYSTVAHTGWNRAPSRPHCGPYLKGSSSSTCAPNSSSDLRCGTGLVASHTADPPGRCLITARHPNFVSQLPVRGRSLATACVTVEMLRTARYDRTCRAQFCAASSMRALGSRLPHFEWRSGLQCSRPSARQSGSPRNNKKITGLQADRMRLRMATDAACLCQAGRSPGLTGSACAEVLTFQQTACHRPLPTRTAGRSLRVASTSGRRCLTTTAASLQAKAVQSIPHMQIIVSATRCV